MDDVDLTPAETRAIRRLQRLAKDWPPTLLLFSWSGSLVVLKPGQGRTYNDASVAHILGIPNDGGDPHGPGLCQPSWGDDNG